MFTIVVQVVLGEFQDFRFLSGAEASLVCDPAICLTKAITGIYPHTTEACNSQLPGICLATNLIFRLCTWYQMSTQEAS